MLFLFTTSTTLATSSSKIVSSRDTMSLNLDKQVSGNSSIAVFNISGIPSDATVTKVLVDANIGLTYGEKGVIVSNRLYI